MPVPGTGWKMSHGLGAAFCLVALAAPLAGQNLLYVENGDKLTLVRRAEENMPMVLDGGKWVEVLGQKFVLKQTEEYLPVMITVHNRYFKRGVRAVSDSGPTDQTEILGSGGRFAFSADFEAPCALDNVVLMLALESKLGSNELYLCGIGHLDAYRSRYVSASRTVPDRLREVHLVLHIFVDGREAFNSEIPAGKRGAALNRMVASRVSSVQDVAVQPLFGAPPAYPAEMKARIKGKAVVSFRVDTRGRVLDPAVASATDPAFGIAALEAIRQWRFVPRVKGGIPVESEAEMPFVFDPPS